MNTFGNFVCASANISNNDIDINNSLSILQNKYIYINQNVPKITRVLINPNFKPTIHINPNFQHKTTSITKTIHVNPLILDTNRKLKCNDDIKNNLTVNDSTETSLDSYRPKYISCNNNKKLIRATLLTETNKPITSILKKKFYSGPSLINSNLKKTNVSKFKVDRRSKLNTESCKHKAECNISTQYVFIKNAKLNKTKYVKLNGKLYKYSRNKSLILNAIKKTSPTLNKSIIKLKKSKIYPLSLQKLKSNSSLKYTKFDSTNKKNVYKFITKEQKDRSRSIIDGKKLVRRKITKRLQVQKLKKCNIPCEIYQRYGQCAKKKLGKCMKIHIPEQIALCTKFLRGACVDNKCLLSHNLAPEKMPTCNYYLEGRCLKDDCPYLHVKVSAKADICKDFLVGYCKLAKECTKRHQYLCPDFEKYNICKKVKCPYPHGNIVRNINLLKEVTKQVKTIKKVSKKERDCAGEVQISKVENNDKNVRYYINQSEKEEENVTDNHDGEMSDVKDMLVRRAKIGSLPTYIPLLDNMTPS